MTSRDIENEFIKIYLKPILKTHGYKTSGQTWWKNMGDFFIIINLQNSQYNSKEHSSFCFNIGIALTDRLRDKERKKATYADFATSTRQHSFLPADRIQKMRENGGSLGYLITDKTDIAEFIRDFKIDFEDNIIETLSKLTTIRMWAEFFEKDSHNRKYLERLIVERNIKT